MNSSKYYLLKQLYEYSSKRINFCHYKVQHQKTQKQSRNQSKQCLKYQGCHYNQHKINTPWHKLFLFTNNKSAIKASMCGFKLKTKLKNKLNYQFNYKQRQSYIKYYTDNLFQSFQNESLLIKKLKEYFLDTLQLQIKDIILEIQIDLHHKIQLIFKFDSFIAKQQQKSFTTKINAKNFNISYKIINSKPQLLLYPVNLQFIRIKQQKKNQIVSNKIFNIEGIHLNINNNNFNDIRRFFYLVEWHNSFLHLPPILWRQKPLPLTKIKPIEKVRYKFSLMLQNIRQSFINKSLNQRRKYLHLYYDILKGTKNINKIKLLSQMEDKMQLWKILAYRNFCIQMCKQGKFKDKKQKDMIKIKNIINYNQNSTLLDSINKNNIQINVNKLNTQQINLIPEKDTDNLKLNLNKSLNVHIDHSINESIYNKSLKNQTQLIQQSQVVQQQKLSGGFSWIRPWFTSQPNQAQLISDLQRKLNQLQHLPTISTISLTVHQIIITVDIITYSAKQNFLSIKACDINFKSIHNQNQQLSHNIEQKQQFICGKFKISYDNYLGHDKKYINLLEVKRQTNQRQKYYINQYQDIQENSDEDNQEEFQDVQNFIEFQNYPEFNVKIQPLQLCINNQIIERLSVFDIQEFQKIDDKIQKTVTKYTDPYQIIKQINKSFKSTKNIKQLQENKNKNKYEKTNIHKQKQQQLNNNNNQLNKQKQIPIIKKTISSSLTLIIPQQMAHQLCPCNQIIIQFPQISLTLISNQYQQKQLFINNIELKCNFPLQTQHNYDVLANMMGSIPLKTITFIQPFGILYKQVDNQKQNKKQTQLNIISPILLNLQSSHYLSLFLQLLHIYRPKQKQHKNLSNRLRLRRKQSIGQEFIDACQNLNEHIVKSTISISDKTKKNIMLINNSRLENMKINIMSNILFKLLQCQINISSIVLQQQKQGNTAIYISSNNTKSITIQIFNIIIFNQYLHHLKHKITKLSSSSSFISMDQSSIIIPIKPISIILDDENNVVDSVKKQININNVNMEIFIYHNKVKEFKVKIYNAQYNEENNKKICWAKVNVMFRKQDKINIRNIKNNININMNMKNMNNNMNNKNNQNNINMNNNQNNKNNKNNKNQSPQMLPLIQQIQVRLLQSSTYNVLRQQIQFSHIYIDINPQTIKFLQHIFSIYFLSSSSNQIKILNSTINHLKLSYNNNNRYMILKPFTLSENINNQKDIKISLTNNQDEEMLINCKESKEIDCYQISKYCYMIKKQNNIQQYQIQSNIKIVNQQDKTVWLVVKNKQNNINNNNMNKQYNNMNKQYNNIQNRYNKNNKHHPSINLANIHNSHEYQQDQQQKQIDLKYLSTAKSFDFPQYQKPHNFHNFHNNNNNFNNNNNNNKNSKHNQSHHNKYHQLQQNINIPLKPKQQYNLLIINQQKYIVIIDQNYQYEAVKISQLIVNQDDDQNNNKNNQIRFKQVIIKNQNQDYLVVRCTRKIGQYNNNNKQNKIEQQNKHNIKQRKQSQQSQMHTQNIFNQSYIPLQSNHIYHYYIQILSPIYITNKLPFTISYHVGTQQIDFQQTIHTQGKIIKRKSFQIIPQQKIAPLQHNKLKSIRYSQIYDLELKMNQYQGNFKISNILDQMVKKRTINKQDKVIQNTLICLSNGKRNIQLILKIQLTHMTIKIKLYPEYVLINLCQIDIFMKIKQNDYTYPEIILKNIKQSNLNHNKNNKHNKNKQQQQNKQIQKFVNTYISFNNERFNQKDVLKQLFYDFQSKLQIFAGEINKKIKRYFVYQSGVQLNSSNSSLNSSNQNISKSQIKKNTGYGSGYGSGSDNNKDYYLPSYTTSQMQVQRFFQYGHNKLITFYRKIIIQQFFTLIMFIPTINIINKSQSIFMIRSKSNKNLIKIQRQQMNYITVNKQGFSIQAVEENQQVNINEWFNIDIMKFGTVYYAKELSSNGYQSREYVLRKKKLKKRPKLFYRIVASKNQKGIQILIQDSLYPPISFINKTNLKLKIQQRSQGYQQQLKSNQMAQFSCLRRPYEQPMFHLYYEQHYRYQYVEIFTVDQFKIIPCSKNSKFIISIQQFKDQKIVIFDDQKRIQRSQIKNQFQIQKIQKLYININQVMLSFMNDFYKEFMALIINDIEFQVEEKNNKKYMKLKIKQVLGYDYSGIQPKIVFQRQLQHSLRQYLNSYFRTLHDTKDPKMLNSNIIISFHKNATIVQKCHIYLSPIKLTMNSYLLLQSIKVYHKQIFNLINILKMYKKSKSSSLNKSQNQLKQSSDSFIKKQFIFESFIWQGTSLTLKCLNLNIFNLFLGKRYYVYIIKFIQWLGDLKPIRFSSHLIDYQNYTIQKLIRKIDIHSKAKEIIKSIVEYPISLFLQICGMLIGVNQKRPIQKAKTIFSVIRAFSRIFIGNGLIPSIASSSLNKQQSKKVSDRLSYTQRFSHSISRQQQKSILHKIQQFQYCQWRYQQKYNPTKLLSQQSLILLQQQILPQNKIKRFQRYNLINQIIPYDMNYSRIKLALDSYCGNKINRKIQIVEQINDNQIIGLTEEYFVVYFVQKQQWKVCKNQEVVEFDVVIQGNKKDKKNKLKESKKQLFNQSVIKLLKIVMNTQQKQEIKENNKNNNVQSNQPNQQILKVKRKLNIYEFTNFWISKQRIRQIQQFIEENKLITQY